MREGSGVGEKLIAMGVGAATVRVTREAIPLLCQTNP